MSECRACGAAIVWADRADGEGRIALDVHESIASEGGYRLTDEGRAVAVEPSSSVLAYMPHRLTCGAQIRRGVPG